MNFMKNVLGVLIITAFFMACNDDDSPSIMDSQEASARALQIVDGQVTSTELDSSGVSNEWEVTVVTDGGGEVELEFDQVTGELVEIEGDEGPFDYEVTPGQGLISFSQAKDVAFNEAEGELISWELEQDGDGNWIYEFIMINDGQDFAIEVDAVTGTIL